MNLRVVGEANKLPSSHRGRWSGQREGETVRRSERIVGRIRRKRVGRPMVGARTLLPLLLSLLSLTSPVAARAAASDSPAVRWAGSSRQLLNSFTWANNKTNAGKSRPERSQLQPPPRPLSKFSRISPTSSPALYLIQILLDGPRTKRLECFEC